VRSLVTGPRPAAAAIDGYHPDLGALRAASRQLVFHYWADGDYAANGIEPERISEIDIRHAAAMFARLAELTELPPSAARQPRQRVVGCCRDFIALFVAKARHKGISSRANTTALRRTIAMGIFGKVYRWREVKIEETRRAAQERALARGASPEEARSAGEKAARRRRRRAMRG
jgi:hypothetical protein